MTSIQYVYFYYVSAAADRLIAIISLLFFVVEVFFSALEQPHVRLDAVRTGRSL